jgi:hypothetical protein
MHTQVSSPLGVLYAWTPRRTGSPNVPKSSSGALYFAAAAPGAAAKERARRKRAAKAAAQPFTATGGPDSPRLVVRVRQPVSEMTKRDAVVLPEQLKPLMKALPARAGNRLYT